MTKLSVKQAAASLGISASTVYALLKQGRIAGERYGCRGKGTWRIEQETLDRYEKSCRSEAKALPPLRHLR